MAEVGEIACIPPASAVNATSVAIAPLPRLKRDFLLLEPFMLFTAPSFGDTSCPKAALCALNVDRDEAHVHQKPDGF